MPSPYRTFQASIPAKLPFWSFTFMRMAVVLTGLKPTTLYLSSSSPNGLVAVTLTQRFLPMRRARLEMGRTS